MKTRNNNKALNKKVQKCIALMNDPLRMKYFIAHHLLSADFLHFCTMLGDNQLNKNLIDSISEVGIKHAIKNQEEATA